MASGMLFTSWVQMWGAPDRYSRESFHLHQWEGWHTCTCPKVMHADGVAPAHHTPKQTGLWEDFISTFINPLIPTIEAMRERLPEEERPTRQERYGIQGTGFSYLGMNLMSSREQGYTNVTFDGTFNPTTNEHYGICVHRDKNNAKRKLGIVLTFGNFSGFEQFQVPFGVRVASKHMSMLWVDDSDMLHAVLPGSGTRMSVVLFNHEWVETGVRPEGKKRVLHS